MKRLTLTDAICIDEVFVDFDEYCKYALVIQDFPNAVSVVDSFHVIQ